jgi:hypothetical protein
MHTRFHQTSNCHVYVTITFYFYTKQGEVPFLKICLPSLSISQRIVANTSYYFVVYWSEFLATDPEIPGSIPGASRFSEKQQVWNGVHSAS